MQIEVGDNMKFSVPAAITAAPGEMLTVVLKGVGQMPKVAMGHNFVLLKKGVRREGVVERVDNARDTEFIAAGREGPGDRLDAAGGPGRNGGRDVYRAQAARRLPVLCSFPGHFALGMKGTVTVR